MWVNRSPEGAQDLAEICGWGPTPFWFLDKPLLSHTGEEFAFFEPETGCKCQFCHFLAVLPLEAPKLSALGFSPCKVPTVTAPSP